MATPRSTRRARLVTGAATGAATDARRLRVPALVLGIALISTSAIGLILTERHQQQAQQSQDASLSTQAAQHTDELEASFNRARSVNDLLSRNPGFAGFYYEDKPRSVKIRGSSESLVEVMNALDYLRDLYPDSLGTSGFVDASGAENVRIVSGAVTAVGDLSADESDETYFAPAFTRPMGDSHVTEPHVSDGTGEWVLTVATPIPTSDGVKRGLVRFEVTMESFRSALADGEGERTVVVDRGSDAVVIDGARPQESGAPLGPRRELSLPDARSGVTTWGGERLAFAPVDVREGNVNEWAVVTSAPAVSSLPAVPLALLIVLGVLGVLVLVFARRGFRAARRELEDARDEALSASRLKSEFLANMSHEIRTPMNGVIGLTGLLMETELDQRQRQYAQGVRGAGESLLAIINDILDFSKIEAGKLELELADFTPVQVVEEAAGLVAQAAQSKGLELVAYCYPGLTRPLQGDATRLRQVLLNLLSNAVKFTERGEVVLRAELVGETDDGEALVRFECADTGIGIDPADQERLFESFSQADASTTRKFGGTGLGLSISRRLVAAMGGELCVDSEPGRGSTFAFTLSLPRGASDEETPLPPLQHLLEGRRALVVDDNETNRLILSEQVGAWGMLVDLANDGAAGLELVRAAAEQGRPYDLVLLDLCMPGMDGLELARRLTADPAPAPHLVLLTSAGDIPEAEARAVGLAARLSKPVRAAELYDTLMRVTAPPRTPEARPSREEATPAAGRGRVLVAEDNAVNQMVAEGILASLGYECDMVATGGEALDALALRGYDAVLMDCQMPEMDGYTATGELRRREGHAAHTPVIAMTAGTMPGDRERCLAAGMDDYVAKPVSPTALDDVLVRWAGRRAGVAEVIATAVAPVADESLPGREVVDADRVAQLREYGPPDGSLLRQVTDRLVSDAPRILTALGEAIQRGDAGSAARAAHELKGAAGNVGAAGTVALCVELESLGANDVRDRGPAVLTRLTSELELVGAALRAEGHSLVE